MMRLGCLRRRLGLLTMEAKTVDDKTWAAQVKAELTEMDELQFHGP